MHKKWEELVLHSENVRASDDSIDSRGIEQNSILYSVDDVGTTRRRRIPRVQELH